MAKKAEKTVKPAETPEKVQAAPVARVVIERVRPEIDGGRFPIKRVTGEHVCVEADIFMDGHDELICFLLHRKDGDPGWTRLPMRPLGKTGLQTSILGVGGYHLGSAQDEQTAKRVVDRAIDEGIIFFHNCRDYHEGKSEE